eukprot:1346824-Amorphochlora_amoeboformis.AAC.1
MVRKGFENNMQWDQGCRFDLRHRAHEVYRNKGMALSRKQLVCNVCRDLSRGKDTKSDPSSEQIAKAMIATAQAGKLLTLKYLLHTKVDPDFMETAAHPLAGGSNSELTVRFTAISAAALHGHPDCVKALLNAKATINLTNEAGESALMWAALGGDVRCVTALVKAKGNPNHISKDGSSPLMWACAGGGYDTFAKLLELKADPKHNNNFGITLYQCTLEISVTDRDVRY